MWAGYRPGWGHRWPLYGAVGFGLASAAYYGGSYPYDHGYYGYDECSPLPQRIWNGYQYRVVWVNPCNYY